MTYPRGQVRDMERHAKARTTCTCPTDPCIQVAGEPMPQSLIHSLVVDPVEPLRSRGRARVELWNVYGPTETIACTAGRMVPGQAVVHIGRPVPGCLLYVLGEDGAMLPPGCKGELWVGGVQASLVVGVGVGVREEGGRVGRVCACVCSAFGERGCLDCHRCCSTLQG